MMQQRRSLLLLVLASLALLALTGRPDCVLDSEEQSATAEARQNNYLGLGQLMAALGAQTTMLPQLGRELPPLSPHGATLWLTVPGRMIGRDGTAELLAWVRAGGRLVLAPRTTYLWEDDPLLAAAGLSLTTYSDDWLEEQLGEESRRPSTRDGFLYAIDDGHAVRARFDMEQGIEPLETTEDDEAAADAGTAAGEYPDAAADTDTGDDATAGDAEPLLCDPVGCHAYRVPLGRGEIVALSDAWPFANYTLGTLDHAAIARELVAPAPGSLFWLVYDEQVPSLFELLWQRAWFVVLALAAAVLLWIVAAGGRFGPLLAGAHPARRRLAEHVAAAGTLLARAGRQRELWQAVHDDFRRTLHRRHPQAQGMDDATLAALVARHAGIDAAQVQAALAPPDPQSDDAALAASIRRLDTLRRLL